MWCTRSLHQPFHQMLVRKGRAELVLKHPLPLHPLRLDHSLRQCVPQPRTFRLSMDLPSVRRRKCRSYKSFERAVHAGRRRTCWLSSLPCIIQTPIQTIRLSGKVLQWGWLGPRWDLQNLVLPGYEYRVQYDPKSSKPYLMCNDNKRAKNSHGSGNNPNTSDGSDRSNQGQRGNNENQGNQGNQGGGYQGNQGGGRGKQRGGYNPNANPNQGRRSSGSVVRARPMRGSNS